MVIVAIFLLGIASCLSIYLAASLFRHRLDLDDLGRYMKTVAGASHD